MLHVSCDVFDIVSISCHAGILARHCGRKAGGVAADYLLRAAVAEDDFMDIRIAVVGNVDAGKSTLLGVLTHGELDNGRGLSRLKLFKHQHEIDSGRTSSVSHDILGAPPPRLTPTLLRTFPFPCPLSRSLLYIPRHI